MNCIFATDLHGHVEKYKKLFDYIEEEQPDMVLLGGDLLPSGALAAMGQFKEIDDFILDYLLPAFKKLKTDLKEHYPRVMLILGNDDPRIEEQKLMSKETSLYWDYIHNQRVVWKDYQFFGYAYVPPTPFLLKDWERYDVSRYVDPGCVHPTEGRRTVVPDEDIEYATIQKDLEAMTASYSMHNAIFLFHSPPYDTRLDRAGLDGQMIDHVPLDTHVGSIAIQRFIESRQPLLTLHGHVHESSRITGRWFDKIGATHMFSAAYDTNELALVLFDPGKLEEAQRIIL